MERALIPRFLPENYRRAAREGGVLSAMLSAMEGMHAPVEAVLGSIDSYVSPHRAPDPFVLMQASWLGLDRYFDWAGGRPGAGTPRFRTGTERLRLLVAVAANLNRERGRRDTLLRFLAIATGLPGFSIEEPSQPFHFVVRAPAAAAPLADLVARIVEGERPAHATYDIVFEPSDPPAPADQPEE